MEDKTLALYYKVQDIRAKGGHHVLADEVIFTTQGY
jgi:hypothetical protein